MEDVNKNSNICPSTGSVYNTTPQYFSNLSLMHGIHAGEEESIEKATSYSESVSFSYMSDGKAPYMRWPSTSPPPALAVTTTSCCRSFEDTPPLPLHDGATPVDNAVMAVAGPPTPLPPTPRNIPSETHTAEWADEKKGGQIHQKDEDLAARGPAAVAHQQPTVHNMGDQPEDEQFLGVRGVTWCPPVPRPKPLLHHEVLVDASAHKSSGGTSIIARPVATQHTGVFGDLAPSSNGGHSRTIAFLANERESSEVRVGDGRHVLLSIPSAASAEKSRDGEDDDSVPTTCFRVASVVKYPEDGMCSDGNPIVNSIAPITRLCNDFVLRQLNVTIISSSMPSCCLEMTAGTLPPLWAATRLVINEALQAHQLAKRKGGLPSRLLLLASVLRGRHIARDLTAEGPAGGSNNAADTEAYMASSPLFGSFLSKTQALDISEELSIDRVLGTILRRAAVAVRHDDNAYLVLTCVQQTCRNTSAEEQREQPPQAQKYSFDTTFSSFTVVSVYNGICFFHPSEEDLGLSVVKELLRGPRRLLCMLYADCDRSDAASVMRQLHVYDDLSKGIEEPLRTGTVRYYVKDCLTMVNCLMDEQQHKQHEDHDDKEAVSAKIASLVSSIKLHETFLTSSTDKSLVVFPVLWSNATAGSRAVLPLRIGGVAVTKAPLSAGSDRHAGSLIQQQQAVSTILVLVKSSEHPAPPMTPASACFTTQRQQRGQVLSCRTGKLFVADEVVEVHPEDAESSVQWHTRPLKNKRSLTESNILSKGIAGFCGGFNTSLVLQTTQSPEAAQALDAVVALAYNSVLASRSQHTEIYTSVVLVEQDGRSVDVLSNSEENSGVGEELRIGFSPLAGPIIVSAVFWPLLTAADADAALYAAAEVENQPGRNTTPHLLVFTLLQKTYVEREKDVHVSSLLILAGRGSSCALRTVKGGAALASITRHALCGPCRSICCACFSDVESDSEAVHAMLRHQQDELAHGSGTAMMYNSCVELQRHHMRRRDDLEAQLSSLKTRRDAMVSAREDTNREVVRMDEEINKLKVELGRVLAMMADEEKLLANKGNPGQFTPTYNYLM